MAVEKQKQKGFSVIEVVVSLFIFSAIYLIYQASLNTVQLNKNYKDQELALRIAQNKIENLRIGGYSTLPASGSFSDPLLVNLSSNGQGSVTNTAYNSKTAQIVVTVSWQEPGFSNTHSVALTTLISSGGLQ